MPLPTLTTAGDTAAQAVGVLPLAQLVDEGSQLMHVVHFSSHHHLFMDDVGLRQVRSLLQGTHTHTHTAVSSLGSLKPPSTGLKSPVGDEITIH